MASLVNRLSDRKVGALKVRGLYADGGGLYVEVTASGSKQWTFIFQWHGKRKQMGLGGVTTLGLADARNAARAARKEVLEGVNPIEARKERAASASGLGVTFGEVADQLIDDLSSGWRNSRSEEQWRMTLNRYVKFRKKLVGQVDTDDILDSLKPIWLRIPETADRTRSRIERVLDAAKANGLRTGENPARWRGHLKHLLPARLKVEEAHHAALPYEDAPAFWCRVCGWPGFRSTLALKLTMLTAVRTNEALEATWGEFDLDGGIWAIPGDRMKLGQEHVIPLVGTAVQLLRDIRPEDAAAEDFVFPGLREGEPANKSLMEKLLFRQKVRETTVHGLRSTFSDWAHDQTDFAESIIEQCLAHQVGSKTKRAYRRGTALMKRRQLLTAWETYLASPSSSSLS